MSENINVASSSSKESSMDGLENGGSPSNSIRYSKSSSLKSSLANPSTSLSSEISKNNLNDKVGNKDPIENFRKIIESESIDSEGSSNSLPSKDQEANSSPSFFDSVWKNTPNSLKISKRSSSNVQDQPAQQKDHYDEEHEEKEDDVKEPMIISYRKGSKKLSRSGSGSNSTIKMKNHARSVSLNDSSLQKSMFKSSVNDDTYRLSESQESMHDGGLEEQLAIAVKSPSFNTKVYSEETVFETKYHYAADNRNNDFHILFKSVLPEEKLIDDFSCALSREILLQGRLYVSDKNVCFNSNILGWVTNLIIPFSDIQSFEKTSTAGLFPNGIAVTTNKLSKHYFATFISRDTTFEFLNSIWLNYIQKYGSNPTGEEVNETYKEEFPSSEDNRHDITTKGSDDQDLETVEVEREDIIQEKQENSEQKTEGMEDEAEDIKSVIRNHSPVQSVTSSMSDASEKRRYLSDPYMSYKTILFKNSNVSRTSSTGSNNDKTTIKSIFPTESGTTAEDAEVSNYIEEEIMSIDEDNDNEEDANGSGSDYETENENEIEDSYKKESKSRFSDDALKTPKKQNLQTSTDLPNHADTAYSPTDFIYDPEENKEIILIPETILRGRIDEVFNMLFGTDFSFQEEYIGGLDGSDITSINPSDLKFAHISKEQVGDDHILADNLQAGKLQRCYAYTKALNYAIGPKSTVVKLVETIETEDIDFQKGLNIVVRSLTPNVPSGGSFYVSTRYLLANAEDNKTKFKLSYFMTWTGSSWVKSIIESSTNSGQKDSAKVLKQLMDKRLPGFIENSSKKNNVLDVKKIVKKQKTWNGLGSPALFQSKLENNLSKSAKKHNLAQEVDSIVTKTEVLNENTHTIYVLLGCILFLLCFVLIFQVYLYLLLKDTRLKLSFGYSSIFTDAGNFVNREKDVFGLDRDHLKLTTQKQIWDWITGNSKKSESLNKEDLQVFFKKLSEIHEDGSNDNILEKILSSLQDR